MKKKIIALVLAISFFLIVYGPVRDIISEYNTSHNFPRMEIESLPKEPHMDRVNGILVEDEEFGGLIFLSDNGDVISLGENADGFELGERIVVYNDGVLLETYPARFLNVFKIERE